MIHDYTILLKFNFVKILLHYIFKLCYGKQLFLLHVKAF